MSTVPPPVSGEPPALLLDAVSKSFGPVVALKSASLRVEHHSIHALVGENGAGKSTLVKIIAGLYQRDSGTFEYRGEPVDFSSTAQSKAAGIAVIYQEPTLFPDLSVTENIFMGRQPTKSFGRIDRKAMRAEVKDLFNQLGVALSPDRPTRGLSIADQQLVEIAKAMSLDARVLIMDEPTAALSTPNSESRGSSDESDGRAQSHALLWSGGRSEARDPHCGGPPVRQHDSCQRPRLPVPPILTPTQRRKAPVTVPVNAGIAAAFVR